MGPAAGGGKMALGATGFVWGIDTAKSASENLVDDIFGVD